MDEGGTKCFRENWDLSTQPWVEVPQIKIKYREKIVFVYFSFQPWQTMKAYDFLQDCLGSLPNYQNLIVKTIKSAKTSKGNIYADKTLVNQGQFKY